LEEKQYVEIRCPTCRKLWFKSPIGTHLDFQIKCGGWCNGLHFVEMVVGGGTEDEEVINGHADAGAFVDRDCICGSADVA
jgi:hypothetical protein